MDPCEARQVAARMDRLIVATGARRVKFRNAVAESITDLPVADDS